MSNSLSKGIEKYQKAAELLIIYDSCINKKEKVTYAVSMQ